MDVHAHDSHMDMSYMHTGSIVIACMIIMHPKSFHVIPGKITTMRLPSPFEIITIFSSILMTTKARIKKRAVLVVGSKRVTLVANPSAVRIITRFFLIAWQNLRQESQAKKETGAGKRTPPSASPIPPPFQDPPRSSSTSVKCRQNLLPHRRNRETEEALETGLEIIVPLYCRITNRPPPETSASPVEVSSPLAFIGGSGTTSEQWWYSLQ
ncbi:hypothetical protein Ddye_008653 [Dipteronia dyeriana]|uniref:Uncharacterized protein n=1 Tax=Dipteronia dyeriana TaxID=168575 RepID=A0AAE0CLK5_9ROSI|nr:hypothetical protein Ddye_008653 [Dipteronia dyeriana]